MAGRCAFVGTIGRCSETGFLEFHHVRPFAKRGATSIENIELRCRAHNEYEAEQCFGPLSFARKRPRSVAVLNSVRTEFTAYEQLGAAEIVARRFVAHFGAGAGCTNGSAVGNGSGVPRAARVKATAGARRVEEP